MTDREQLCKEFTELTGGHWHECRWDNTVKVYKCLECELTSGTPIQNPTYTNPADALKVMMEREDGIEFVEIVGGYDHCDWPYVKLAFIIEPDSLLKAAVEFLKEGKK